MRSPRRTHERQSFFKYTSAATARNVLSTCSLRWSSPLRFNDPFDVPRELSFGVTPDVLAQASVRRMIHLINDPPEDTASLFSELRLIIETVKNGISPELRSQLIKGIEDVAASARPTGTSMDELRHMWRTLLPDHRILCLTESSGHAAMWYHYADQYRGVVLEFRCLDELDSSWLGAKPMTYPHSKPEIYTADGWAELLTYVPEIAVAKVLDQATYTKSPDWSYEGEWRISSFKHSSEMGDFSDYRFDPRELAAVYFGPMISAIDR